jgi:hypothetical protein
MLAAEFNSAPRCRGHANDAFELAAEMIDITKSASLRHACDRRPVAHHERLRRDEPFSDKPSAGALPQAPLKKPPRLRSAEMRDSRKIVRAPPTAKVSPHCNDHGGKRIASVALSLDCERLVDEPEELAHELVQSEVQVPLPIP